MVNKKIDIEGTTEDDKIWDEILSSPESVVFLEEMAKKALEEFERENKNKPI